MQEPSERKACCILDPPYTRSEAALLQSQLEQRDHCSISFRCLRLSVRVYLNPSSADERIRRIDHNLILRSEPGGHLDRISVVMADADWNKLHTAVTNDTYA